MKIEFNDPLLGKFSLETPMSPQIEEQLDREEIENYCRRFVRCLILAHPLLALTGEVGEGAKRLLSLNLVAMEKSIEGMGQIALGERPWPLTRGKDIC